MVAKPPKKNSHAAADRATASKSRGKQHKRIGKKSSSGFYKRRLSSRSTEEAEIKSLEERIKAEAPKAGRGSFVGTSGNDKEAAKQAQEASGPALTMTLFKELPLSRSTLSGLAAHKFVKLTEIQRGAIPHALAGRDILGEARTGSGKTLAFVVPMLELLFRVRWTRMDGLGALVVSPTRELAYQIFKVVGEVGTQHDFSAGCIMGGRELSEEQKSVSNMNILIATPGRLLQHLDESPGFDASNLQILAIDEADRILDFGFQETLQNIFAHLPTERQTLLFSATLHTSVHRLGKAALKSPEIISVHRDAKSRTPDKLKQVYMTVALERKVDVLFSFLRTHSQKKLIIFVSACKQVRFFFEVFKQLKPGPAIMELHGRQSLAKRMLTFNEFTERDRAVALLCTDIAARGVDFPVVDWVVQLDCPDSVDSYVHRVGRTARYEKGGHAALFLLPSEDAFVAKLRTQRIDVKSINAKQGKVVGIERKLQSVVASDSAIKHLAQKAFISYVRSVMLMKDKEVFKVQELPKEGFALSLGLVVVPTVPQLKDSETDNHNTLKVKKNMSGLQRLKERIKAKKAAKAAGQLNEATGDDSSRSEDPDDQPAAKKLSKWERAQRRIAKMKAAASEPAPATNEEDDLLRPVTTAEESAAAPVPTEAPSKKRKLKIGRDGVALGVQGQHTFFAGSKGKASSELAQLAEDVAEDVDDATHADRAVAGEEARKAFLARVSRDLAERDTGDAALSRARVQEQKRLAKKRRKQEEDGSDVDDEEQGVTLGGANSASSRSPSPDSESSEQEEEAPPKRFAKPKKKAPIKAPSVPAPRPRTDNVAESIGAGDDLGALEREALSKLASSGLF